MAQHAQSAKPAADQNAEQDVTGFPIFLDLRASGPLFSAFQLAQQKFLVLHSLDQKIGAANDPLIGTADLTGQRIVGAVFLDPLHPQNLIRSGRQMGRPGKGSQELLGFQESGGG